MKQSKKSIINQGVVSCFLGFWVLIFALWFNRNCPAPTDLVWFCGKTRFFSAGKSLQTLSGGSFSGIWWVCQIHNISVSPCINMSLEVQVDNFWKDVSIKTALFRKGVLSFQGIILSSLTYRSGGPLSHLYWRSRKVANYRHPLPMSGSHKITMMKENHKSWMGVMGEDSPQSWKSTKKLQKQSVHVCTVQYIHRKTCWFAKKI